MYDDEIKAICELKEKIDENFRVLRIDQYRFEIQKLRQKQADPEIYSDHNRSKKLNIELKKYENLVLPWDELKTQNDDLLLLAKMAAEARDPAYSDEIGSTYKKLHETETQLELLRIFTSDDDILNCYLSIHSGAGGTESCDWAEMVFRMYTRWLDLREFKWSVLEYQDGDEAGIKSATVLVQGSYAYGYLCSEIGVHRLVRISPFDSNKRRHTSFCSVSAVPEVDDEIEVEIKTADLKIDTYRSSGAGGQHVNTTDSAVRITHLPSGIVVTCQSQRSQIQNREKAMKMLKGKLYQKEKLEREAAMKEKEGVKKKIEWGSQIRSYVFHPYNLVKDHRTGYETSNLSSVMDGGIDDFIYAWLKME